MALCCCSSILKEESSFPWGSNWKNPEDVSCVTLGDCKLDVADNRIENKAQLLLARAGTILLFVIFSDFSINL